MDNVIKNIYNIGVQHLDAYPEKRNIIGVIENASYIEVDDIYKKRILFKNKLRSYSKLKKIFGKFLKQTSEERYSFKLKEKEANIDFFHFFNTISIDAKQPWGVTFETLLPCFDNFLLFHKSKEINGNANTLKGIEKYLKYLADDNCKFIIAISQNAFNIQKEVINYFPKYKNSILSKMVVFHPPQKLLLNSIHNKKENSTINFCLVGNDLLGKGGGEVLKVFDLLSLKYTNFHLYLIGEINLKTDNTSDYSLEDINKFFKMIENNPLITHYKKLNNDVLLNLLKNKIDVGLLPTRSDTYGYSVLEFQAAGCPVVSTDLRALKEINNNELGWLIKVEKNSFGESFHFTKDDLQKLSSIIKNQLEIIIKKIVENPKKEIEIKRKKCLQRITQNHSFDNYSEKVFEVYKNHKK